MSRLLDANHGANAQRIASFLFDDGAAKPGAQPSTCVPRHRHPDSSAAVAHTRRESRQSSGDAADEPISSGLDGQASCDIQTDGATSPLEPNSSGEGSQYRHETQNEGAAPPDEPNSLPDGQLRCAPQDGSAAGKEPFSASDGHQARDTQSSCATDADPLSTLSGHIPHENQEWFSASVEPNVEQGQAKVPTPANEALPAPADTITAISLWEKQRDDTMRAEGDLTRRIKATCRRIGSAQHPGDDEKAKAAATKVAEAIYKAVNSGVAGREEIDEEYSIRVTLEAREAEHKGKLHCEKKLRALAKHLPIYGWMEGVRGFGDIGLAQIVGKCGDLSNYGNPAKVWKRMGMGIVDGKRQQKIAGNAELAIRHGYSPRRRSTMFVIGDSLVKCPGPYREVYLARKVYEAQKAEAAGLTVLASADIAKAVKKGAKADAFMSHGHIHARAQRYMEKRLLRDLWVAWKSLHGLRVPETSIDAEA